MKRIFTDAADLLNTTITVRAKEDESFKLGMGDPSALIVSGLMARSNAAASALDDLTNRKKKDNRFADLVYEQMRQSLIAINAELEWLEDQIKIEEKAIQTNNTDIDFVRTLDEGNIMGADGKPRDDVKALLKKHGYNNADDMAVADIMLVLQAIETDLHNDNMIRKDRIADYQDRSSDLRDQARDMQKHLENDAPPELREQLVETVSRQPYEVNYRAMKEAQSEEIITMIAEAELTERANSISETFKPF